MAIKKGGYRSYRKAPKKTAPLSSWEKYEVHMAAVDKHNAEVDKKKAQKKALAEKKKKLIAKVVKKKAAKK